jgi:hypothetical protein
MVFRDARRLRLQRTTPTLNRAAIIVLLDLEEALHA